MYPIVYIHKWTHKYLEISIQQSLKNNKRIILIWDEKNQKIAKKYWIEWESFDEYNTNNFKKYYKHNKPNTNYEFELMCYERWFVLLEIMKKNKIDSCLYLDSDILYYWNIDEEFKRIEKYWEYKLAYPNFSWHTTYVFSQVALTDFCNFMMKCYKDKEMYKKLLNRPLIYQTWISDMSMFQLYKFYHSDDVFDLTKDYWDKIVYDWFINAWEWYKTIFGKKYFKLTNNKVYIFKENKRFETKTLHFQMHMKTFMWLVFKDRLISYYLGLFLTFIVEWIYKHFHFVRKIRKKRKDNSLFK